MRILSFKPGHDGHIAYLEDGKLLFSIEAEKDSWPRYSRVSPTLFLRASVYIDSIPDVIAVSGWTKGFDAISDSDGSGYFGISKDLVISEEQSFFGSNVQYFSSTHERSHIFCAYGLSPFPQGQPCYALTWEGNIGAFYYVDEDVNITKIGDVLEEPGNKYAYLYALADPSFPTGKGKFRFEDAGKLMALASYGKPGNATKNEANVIDFLLKQKSILLSLDKKELQSTPYYNVGVETQLFKNLARKYSDEIFNRFYQFAKNKELDHNLPLLISGGCGLNCGWNSQWRESGLFKDVFVPPCPNDSGSAIGTAIEAQHQYFNQAKVDWNVYSGEEFVLDETDFKGLEKSTLDFVEVANFIAEGNIIAWVQGKYEIGPRALGNRSIIAEPFSQETHKRLNKIKQRESFRPIAPICLEKDIDNYFEHNGSSQHMLYFQYVKVDFLNAITHIDNSTRMQTVNKHQNYRMHMLLTAFKEKTGHGVLCNTSLNFKGTGFINRISDLVKYAIEHRLNGFVVNNHFYIVHRYVSD